MAGKLPPTTIAPGLLDGVMPSISPEDTADWIEKVKPQLASWTGMFMSDDNTDKAEALTFGFLLGVVYTKAMLRVGLGPANYTHMKDLIGKDAREGFPGVSDEEGNAKD